MKYRKVFGVRYNMAPKRKITVDLPNSRKSRDRNDRMERSASDSKSSRDNSRAIDKERSDRNERSNAVDRSDDLNRSSDRERAGNKPTPSGSSFPSDRGGNQRDRERDRGGGDSQQHRASVFSRLGKGPVSTSSSSKTSITQQKGMCRAWAETGQCQYGTECRYKHMTSFVSPSKRSSTTHEAREKDKDREGGRSAGQR